MQMKLTGVCVCVCVFVCVFVHLCVYVIDKNGATNTLACGYLARTKPIVRQIACNSILFSMLSFSLNFRSWPSRLGDFQFGLKLHNERKTDEENDK